MSVYKRQGRADYSYDFVIQGRRFSGSTERTSRREAEAVEKAVKAQVAAELDRAKSSAALPLTWGQARDRYWTEVGQHWRGGGAGRMKTSLDWLDREIGRDTPLVAIRNPKVAELVAIRRGEGVAPATVNRSCTEPLRRVLNRAARVWEQDLPRIDWRSHILSEPRERVRELTMAEQDIVFGNLRPDYHPIVAFALASGVRISGCVALEWKDIDWGERRISICGKGGHDYVIPLSKHLRAILWPLQGQHAKKVFAYVAQRSRDGRRAGEFYPITLNGLMTEWRRMKTDAGGELENYRFHDNRHTRATRLLRQTGNLRMVQKLLGHSRIETTARYAHVTDDDLLSALDNDPHTMPHTEASSIDKLSKKSI